MNTRERITNFKLKIMSENSRKEECSRIFLHVGTFILHGTFWLFIMNFTSLQKLAKNFTQFSSFDETLIIGALSSTSLSKENLNELTNLATQMITFCKELQSITFWITVNNMEGKLNRLYLLTISDRGYIWGK